MKWEAQMCIGMLTSRWLGVGMAMAQGFHVHLEEGRGVEMLLDIEPLAGRLVLFESERFFHEVFSSVIVTFIYVITNPLDLMLLELIHGT